MSKQIVVYGNYGHNNIGDELFKVAFKNLFPDYIFTFTDNLTVELLKDKDALFFGGGSFLNQSIAGYNLFDFMYIIDNIPIFYIGVGIETEIHADHYSLLDRAKLIAIRSERNIIYRIANTQWSLIDIPDLAWLTKDKNVNYKSDKEKYSYKDSILILPNVSVMPNHSSPSWITSSWENFKNQFAQFLDQLVDDGFKPIFCPMSTNRIEHDNFASYQIVSMMKNKDEYFIDHENVDECDILWYINKFDYVITQRFHGIVLSEMVNTKVLPIYHHDKLKVTGAIPYYECSKHKLLESFYSLKESNISIDYSVFDRLKQKVEDILK